MPGASAATQSSRCSSKPNDPSPVSATMPDTPVSSAKISVGTRILRCIGHVRFRPGFYFRWFRGLSFISTMRRGSRLFGLANGADHVERALRIILEFVAQNAFAAIEGILQAHRLPLDAAELLGGEKRLREEVFEPPRAAHYLAVFGRKLLHPQHRHNVLEILVLRQRLAYFLRQFVMLFAHNTGRCHFRTGLEQIDRRIKAFAGALAREH